MKNKKKSKQKRGKCKDCYKQRVVKTCKQWGYKREKYFTCELRDKFCKSCTYKGHRWKKINQ